MNIAVIGLGNMGSSHVNEIKTIRNANLFGVCDLDVEKADGFAEKYQAKPFYNYQEVLVQKELDAIIIATPHYDHTPIAIDALRKGIHVLTEKPIAVHANDAKKMITAYQAAKKEFPGLVFAAMFQQRTHGYWKKIKDLIDSGELGKLVRTTWIITDWFRTQYYYDTGGWRATWKGEGGGVLLNQCPHNLDLFQWFVGMPEKVHGFVGIGKYHNIEVEDEVTGFFEYENGMVGHFITTTAESPGTNRLEIVGEQGKLVFESGKLTFYRNRESMLATIKSSPKAFTKVENWVMDIPFDEDHLPAHRQVILNFIDAIENNTELIAPAIEGINSVSIGNAILLSSLLHKPVELPLDGDLYEGELIKLIKNSTYHKNLREKSTPEDFSQSF
jgi:predicted dehydrogenase